MAQPTAQSLTPFQAASPFELMDQRALSQMAEMQQRMDRQMDSMFDFSSIRRFDQAIDQQMRDMDRQMDRAFGDMRRLSQEMDRDLERTMRQLQQQQPGIRIERQEQTSARSYR